jgi:membrane protease YdiL (CAAX protease family)
VRATIAFAVIYVVFDRFAVALGSMRGEWGLVVCAVVLLLTVGAEHQLTGASPGQSVRALGLGAPAGRALAAGVALSAGLLACLPLLAGLTGTTLAVRDGATWLVIGMLAQAGVAEEALFRGFMYRHLRRRRTFWRAACVSAVPFTLAHVPLVFTLAPAIALMSLGMALALSFPFAWLFDRADGSIWPGAILHATIQGGIKVLVDDAATFQNLALAWVASGLVSPWLLFLLRERVPAGRS